MVKIHERETSRGGHGKAAAGRAEPCAPVADGRICGGAGGRVLWRRGPYVRRHVPAGPVRHGGRPGLHCLSAAAGAALGYALWLPIDAAAPYLVAAAVLCLWRVFARAEDNAGQITAAAVGAVAFCTVRMAAALAGGDG